MISFLVNSLNEDITLSPCSKEPNSFVCVQKLDLAWNITGLRAGIGVNLPPSPPLILFSASNFLFMLPFTVLDFVLLYCSKTYSLCPDLAWNITGFRASQGANSPPPHSHFRPLSSSRYFVSFFSPF